jgi:type IV secretory pathway component VirB8
LKKKIKKNKTILLTPFNCAYSEAFNNNDKHNKIIIIIMLIIIIIIIMLIIIIIIIIKVIKKKLVTYQLESEPAVIKIIVSNSSLLFHNRTNYIKKQAAQIRKNIETKA